MRVNNLNHCTNPTHIVLRLFATSGFSLKLVTFFATFLDFDNLSSTDISVVGFSVKDAFMYQ